MTDTPWYLIENVDDVPSPALLLYRERIDENVRQLIAIAGDVARLRPHMKTHKLPQLIDHSRAHGITKFKCATIAEAELAASCGAPDVLLAYQPVGPNVARLRALVARFPGTRFSALVDDETALARVAEAFERPGPGAIGADPDRISGGIELLLDLDVGMHRSGIEPGARAARLYADLARRRGVRAGGLHAYDGHIRDSDPWVRTEVCDRGFAAVERFRDELRDAGLPVPRVVAGGSPTVAIHARRPGVELSPGTIVLWDAGYASQLPDLPFQPAAVLLTRVVSKPGDGRVCLDLGHKAVASEMPHPRVLLLDVPDARALQHSEEHLVIETARAEDLHVGDCCYAIPWHVCPTVALHGEAVVVSGGRATERWKVVARDRRITI
jgi:D-threonine aldolase